MGEKGEPKTKQKKKKKNTHTHTNTHSVCIYRGLEGALTQVKGGSMATLAHNIHHTARLLPAVSNSRFHLRLVKKKTKIRNYLKKKKGNSLNKQKKIKKGKLGRFDFVTFHLKQCQIQLT